MLPERNQSSANDAFTTGRYISLRRSGPKNESPNAVQTPESERTRSSWSRKTASSQMGAAADSVPTCASSAKQNAIRNPAAGAPGPRSSFMEREVRPGTPAGAGALCTYSSSS